MRRLSSAVLVLCILGFLGAVTAMAQPRRMSPEERTDTLASRLSLSAEQKAKVLDIFKQSDTVMRKAFEEHQGDRDAMREAMGKNRDTVDTKMKKVLTEEQYDQWQKMRQDMQGRGRNRSMQ